MKLNLREFEDYLGLCIGIKKLMKCQSTEAGVRDYVHDEPQRGHFLSPHNLYALYSPVFLWVLFTHDCKGKLLFLTQSKERKLQ